MSRLDAMPDDVLEAIFLRLGFDGARRLALASRSLRAAFRRVAWPEIALASNGAADALVDALHGGLVARVGRVRVLGGAVFRDTLDYLEMMGIEVVESG